MDVIARSGDLTHIPLLERVAQVSTSPGVRLGAARALVQLGADSGEDFTTTLTNEPGQVGELARADLARLARKRQS